MSLQLQEKLAKLPNWTWDDKKKIKEDLQWEEGLENLRRRMAANRNRLPSQRSASKDDKQAFNFAVRRRVEYKKGTLRADKIAALEDIEGWRW